MTQRTCSVEGCDRPSYQHGLCNAHESRRRRGADMLAPIQVRGREHCSVDGCGRPHQGRGYCNAHLKRLDAFGDVLADKPIQPRRVSPEERFWPFVVRSGPDDCWAWTGTKNDGYGRFRVSDTVLVLAHRFSFETTFGPVPAGYQLDHTCHSRDASCPGGACPHRACVNPSHLEVVSASTNAIRRERGLVA